MRSGHTARELTTNPKGHFSDRRRAYVLGCEIHRDDTPGTSSSELNLSGDDISSVGRPFLPGN